MKTRHFSPLPYAFVLVLIAVLCLGGCHRRSHSPSTRYVTAPRVTLRDRVAMIYNKVGEVTNGERVEVLTTDRHFARVRTPGGQVGWMEERFLVGQDVYEAFQKLAAENRNDPVQGIGVVRAELNMHIAPNREAERLYQLSRDEKVELLKRASSRRFTREEILAQQQQQMIAKRAAEAVARDFERRKREEEQAKKSKIPRLEPPPRTSPPGPPASMLTKTPPEIFAEIAGDKTPPPPPPTLYDDWWLVRNSRGDVGWALASMIYLDVPLDVAQYSGGQRIIGAFKLNTVNDPEKGAVPQYLMLLNQPKDGLPYDFDEARVFTWSTRHHRYETAFVDRHIMGYLPAMVSEEKSDGNPEPVFTLLEKNEDGTITPRKYRMEGTIVRRVLVPGEKPEKAASPVTTKADRPKSREKKREVRHKPALRREHRRR